MQSFYKLIFKAATPFVKWWGKLHIPFTHKRVTGRHYYLLRDKITVGTVLLTTTNGEFSNLINPEKIKHAGIYAGDIYGNGIRYVVEALGKGVVTTDLVTFLTTKDLVIGCEPNYLTDRDKAALPDEAKKILGIPYDFLFEKDSKALYCFEAAAYLLKMVRPEIRLNCKEIIKGKKTFSYETFLNDDMNFTVVFNSDKV